MTAEFRLESSTAATARTQAPSSPSAPSARVVWKTIQGAACSDSLWRRAKDDLRSYELD